MSARVHRFVPVLLACALAACQSSETAAPQAAATDVASAVSAAAEAEVATNPLCDTATFAEVAAVVGGNIAKHDVIEGEGMESVDCVFLDPGDLYNGLSIRFVTTDLLTKAQSPWSSAVAYFAEWGRSGTSVSGLGDAAAWVALPEGLLVHRGDHVIHFSAGRADMKDAAVRARFETLAGQVVARLP
jgi:hypothetical protein